MGTRKTSRSSEKINCKTCGKEYTPMCDYMQGRCPYHPAMINTTTASNRFQNILNFFKRNK
jgi:hypothetical protein